ncbi:MAG: aminoacyl-tRNA hydrolase [Gemmatimonadota bacterium]
MKVVCGLGNPGPEYAATRHNVGWWAVDELHEAWDFPPFRREGPILSSGGEVAGWPVLLVKPLTYTNRSGVAVAPLARLEDFDVTTDLLVVVDDAALEPGRLRFRPSGSSGGHNGLKSVEAALRTRDYPRLRLGVGGAPEGEDLAAWVLAPFEAEDERRVVELLPIVVEVVGVWVEEGNDSVSRYNR